MNAKQNLVLFGGSGGLGSQLIPYLTDAYNVCPLSSAEVDVTCFGSVDEFFAVAADVDIVLNLSGFNSDHMLHKIADGSLDAVNRIIDVNVRGSLYITAACLPHMRLKGWGRIVHISSVLAERPYWGTGVYSGCKAFIESMTKVCALENAKYGITCNAIRLGHFDGGMVHRIPMASQPAVLDRIPLKRWGNINELAVMIDQIIRNPYLTGSVIPLDGGESI
jgi:NAD(P)-dependent dehydrogenase (short-subunit alcohol dehydrogenase family)